MSGGIRSVQMIKQTLISLKVVGIPESVAIACFSQPMAEGEFGGSEALQTAAVTMLNELERWCGALAVLRS